MYYRRMRQTAQNPVRRNKLFLFPLIAVVVVLAVGFLSPAHTAIVLKSNNLPFLMFAVREQNVFSFSYIHPENGGRVTDTIERVGDKLVMRSILFEKYDENTPDRDDYPAAKFETTGDGLLITDIDLVYTAVDLLADSASDPILYIKGHEYRLTEYLLEPGNIIISADRVNLRSLTQFDPNLDLSGS